MPEQNDGGIVVGRPKGSLGLDAAWKHPDRARSCKDVSNRTMTVQKPSEETPATKAGQEAKPRQDQQPDWANGLRRLYDSVVEEELPDSFKDLLSQLDSKG